MKAKVTLEMTTIGYQALQAYLKWHSQTLTDMQFAAILTSLGYKIDLEKGEESLARNLLLEME